jgi:hypothetical protein
MRNKKELENGRDTIPFQCKSQETFGASAGDLTGYEGLLNSLHRNSNFGVG